MTARAPIGPQVRVRCLRRALGVPTLAEFRERIAEHGVSVSDAHLSNVELGHQRASEALLIAMAGALGINVLDIWQTSEPAVMPVTVSSDGQGVA